MLRTTIGLAALLMSSGVAASDTYDDVVAGTKCSQSQPAYQRSSQMDCEFKVGRSLYFEVAGVGQPDVAFTVYKADIDGDYYASFPLSGKVHDCAIIKPGRKAVRANIVPSLDVAFVSGRTGRVFRTWEECRDH